MKFAFGENWLSFVKHVDEQRVLSAQRSLQEALRVDDLRGRTFLDAGAGSGLFSLAAARMGAARVHSVDFDPDSVASMQLLKDRFAPELETWTIKPCDLVDVGDSSRLGQFDVVYCYGVLHHTGGMWRAFDNLMGTVAPGGLLAISIYNSQGRKSDRWRAVKRMYNRLPRALRAPFAAIVWLPFEARYAARALTDQPGAYLRTWTGRDRGMSKWHDIVDWVGGYPFEVARPEQVFDRCREHGMELLALSTVGGNSASNEFLFRRAKGSGPCAE